MANGFKGSMYCWSTIDKTDSENLAMMLDGSAIVMSFCILLVLFSKFTF